MERFFYDTVCDTYRTYEEALEIEIELERGWSEAYAADYDNPERLEDVIREAAISNLEGGIGENYIESPSGQENLDEWAEFIHWHPEFRPKKTDHITKKFEWGN